MGKEFGEEVNNSVLQKWVMHLPMRMQGGLLVATRGCDLAPKEWIKVYSDAPSIDVITDDNYSLEVKETTERQLVQFLRYCIMNPADIREVNIPGAFFRSKPPENFKASYLGHYPLHWFTHIMHALEIVGYEHPDSIIKNQAIEIYNKMVHSLHLNPETRDEMWKRLTTDRIKTNTVVS